MTDTRPPLSPFDDETFATVASETGLGADPLRDLTRRHQEGVRDLPGVDDIVYEWRNHFHLDPLVVRTETAYVLALPDHVWEEFAEGLAASGEAMAALKSVHDRQARRLAADTDRFEGDRAVVLTRP
jgi:hypothetical protein